jgi:hypothetical protein
MDERDKSLQFKIIEELEFRTLNQRGVISLPEVYSVLEAVFHYNRKAGKQLLYELEKQGFIRLIPCQGIEIIRPRITVLSEI